jgi:hypothetical protein
VQGQGTHVALDDVRIAQLDCSNPGRFDTLHDDDIVDAVSVSVSDAAGAVGWGRGGIGDPALSEGVFTSAGGAHHFTLLFDGSPVDRASDVIGHLPLSIGGADTTRAGSDGLVLDDLCTSWSPRGVTTACMPQGVAAGHAVIELGHVMRDPTLYPEGGNAAAIGSYRVAWVGDPETGTGSVLYNTVLNAPLTSRITSAPAATTFVGDDGCRVRQPLILPLVGSTDWLLLYLCENEFPPIVHGASLAGDTATRLPELTLGETELGPLAQQGVIDIAGVVFVYDGVPTYRVWLTARPTPTETAILYVEGTPPPGSAAGTPPKFAAFAGNPVLTETSSVFDSCGLGCQLHGITATRISDQPTQVRLLVERWVDTGSGLTYGLVPLEQVWPSDHP